MYRRIVESAQAAAGAQFRRTAIECAVGSVAVADFAGGVSSEAQGESAGGGDRGGIPRRGAEAAEGRNHRAGDSRGGAQRTDCGAAREIFGACADRGPATRCGDADSRWGSGVSAAGARIHLRSRFERGRRGRAQFSRARGNSSGREQPCRRDGAAAADGAGVGRRFRIAGSGGCAARKEGPRGRGCRISVIAGQGRCRGNMDARARLAANSGERGGALAAVAKAGDAQYRVRVAAALAIRKMQRARR